MYTFLLRALVILSLGAMAGLHPGWVKGTGFKAGPWYASSCNDDGEMCSRADPDEVALPGDITAAGKLVLVGGFLVFLGAAGFGILGHTSRIERVRRRTLDVLQVINAVTLAAMGYFVVRTSTALDGKPTEVAIMAILTVAGIMGILHFAVRRHLRAP